MEFDKIISDIQTDIDNLEAQAKTFRKVIKGLKEIEEIYDRVKDDHTINDDLRRRIIKTTGSILESCKHRDNPDHEFKIYITYSLAPDWGHLIDDYGLCDHRLLNEFIYNANRELNK